MWKRKQNAEHVDLHTGMHIIHLENTVSGAIHIHQIAVGHPLQDKEAKDLDPRAEVEAKIEELNAIHRGMNDYAKKHNVQVKGKK